MGSVLSAEGADESTRALRELNDFLADDPRVEAVMLPISDGAVEVSTVEPGQQRLQVADEGDEVGDARIMAELHQERRHMAAVVRLVIEEVRHRLPERMVASDAFGRAIAERRRELRDIEAADPGLDVRVGLGALAA